MFTLESINLLSKNTLVENLGIEFTEIGEDYLVAAMPVNSGTRQPLGHLHGGASVTLAETLGSIGATMVVDPNQQYCVGLDINANHVKSVNEGIVTGTARPLHIGKRTHVWEIKITNEKEQLVCISRITMAIIDKKA